MHGDVNCFTEGKLNVSHNCIDRHVPTRGEQAAIVWESDEVGVSRTVSYAELGREVSRIANAMKHIGVRKGDVVTLYMPMIPELAMAMLACTRIGAVHSVVFAGFSADALRDRVVDCKSHYVFTANEGKRGGRTLALKEIVDEVMLSFYCVFVLYLTRHSAGPSPREHRAQGRGLRENYDDCAHDGRERCAGVRTPSKGKNSHPYFNSLPRITPRSRYPADETILPPRMDGQ